MEITETSEVRDSISKLTKDLKEASKKLSTREARYLADAYYQIQEYRKAATFQVLTLEKSKEPNAVLSWFLENAETLEAQIKRALDAYSDSNPLGRWSKSICGIGPVIAAGLMAYVPLELPDQFGTMTPVYTVGNIWRFAGLDPTLEWTSKEQAKTLVKEYWNEDVLVPGATAIQTIAQLTNRTPWRLEALAKDRETGKITSGSLERAIARRPWNAGLKTLCWKIGESFVKVSNNPNDYYGKVWVARKRQENDRNASGVFAQQAVDKLKKFNIGKGTEAYLWYSGAFVGSLVERFVQKGLDFSVGQVRQIPTAKEIGLLRAGKLDKKSTERFTKSLIEAYGPDGSDLNVPEGPTIPMLPPGHIHSRAKRYAVKLFLSHWHEVAFETKFGKKPPKPYVLDHVPGHGNKIGVPNWPLPEA